MSLAGSDLESSIALIASANKVIQDPSQVGNALRTIALRIRGTSSEGELAEIGEDTEGLLTESKMREEILGLSGVDIIDQQTGGYRELREILVDVGNAYEDMSSMEQAAITELLAGKNRANVLAAILQNVEDLEGAYDSAMDAEGSAYRENQAYLDSIQGRVDLFMNALQTFWMNLISSDMAKFVVDQGTAIIQFLDTVHGKLIAIGAVLTGYLKTTSVFDSLKFGANALLGTDFKQSKATVAASKVVDGAAAAKVFAADFGQAMRKNATGLGISQAISKNIKDPNMRINMRDAVTSALGVANLSEIGELTKAQQKQALEAMNATAATQNLNKAQTAAAISASGLSKATTATTLATGGLKGAVKSLWAVLSPHPLIIAAAAAAALTVVLDIVTVTAQEASDKAQEKFNEIADVVDNTKATVKSLEDEIDSINEQISSFEGKTLTFTDSQELQRLKQQRDMLEGDLEIQERLLETQEEVAATQAATAMKKFMKATSATGDEAKKTYQSLGMLAGGVLAITGILLALPTAGASLGATAAGIGTLAAQGAIVAGGAYLGYQAGGNYASAHEANKINSFDDWYQTYKVAYQERIDAEEKALAEYEKDSSNMYKLDKWQEAQQATAEMQTQMYDNLSQIDTYINAIDYGQGYDDILDEYYNFRDKLNIDGLDGLSKAGAKGNALDRIFGENASKDVKELGNELKNLLDEGDIDEIDLIEKVRNIPELAEQLDYLGITTDELTDYFRGVGAVGSSAFWDLSDAMSEAAQAQDKITAALGVDADANYNTRDEALDKMNELLKAGAIGSESNLWNIAEAMGFTYEASDTIDENAAALKRWMKVRNDWYHTDDSGNPTKDGAIAFAEDFEGAVDSSKALQELGVKAGFDEEGNFSFDFSNQDIDAVVKALAETDEMFGITKEEFMDQLTHLGQFIDIQWSNADDLLEYMNSLGASSASAKDQLESLETPLQQLLKAEGLSENEIAKLLDGNGEIEGVSEDLEKLIKIYRDLRDQTRDPLEFFNQDNIDSAVESLQAELDKRESGKEHGDSDVIIEQDLADDIGKFADIGYNKDSKEMYISFEKLEEYAEEAGVDVEELTDKLEECGKAVHDIKITDDDPLGLDSFGDDTDAAIDYLDRLGVKIDEIEDKDGNVNIHLDVDSLIQVLAEAGLTEEQIQSTLTDLGSKGYQFSITNAEGKVESVNITNDKGELKKKFTDKIKEALQDIGASTDANVTVTENGKLIWQEDTSAISKGKDFDDSALLTWKENTKNVSTNFSAKGTVTWTSGNNVRVKVVKNANGTAHLPSTVLSGAANASGNWGVKKTETSLVGELGPELIVRGDRWFTVGDRGPEFTTVHKNDIIFNHKQTEDLFKNGYVTSRGKGHAWGTAHAQGTAYVGGAGALLTGSDYYYDSSSSSVKKKSNSSTKKSSKKTSDYSKDFEEVFDWFEIRIQEINEQLDLLGAKLANGVNHTDKLNVLDQIIATNKTQLSTLEKGLKLYDNYAKTLLSKISSKYRDEAQDGRIAIEEFAGAADEKTLEAIKNYREWAEKVADLKTQIQETKTEIAELAKQKIDTTLDRANLKATLQENQNKRIQADIDYDEERGYITSGKYYEDMAVNIKQQVDYYLTARKDMQEALDKAVKNGDIIKYSDTWYEAIEQMYAVDAALDECNLTLEEYQNTINQLRWDNFDELINRFDYINNEVDSLIDLLDNIENPVITPETDAGWSANEVEWTDEGLTQLGLYAEKMELAKYQADKYAEEIEYLNKQYKAGKYSETEYLEKLNELKQGQYDAIEVYNDSRDAMVELNEARVDAIKEGIEKQIEALEELIDKKKEELDAEKDLYDFQKSVMEQQKDISKIERQLAALSGDNSASAMAKRRQLEAELAEARAQLDETYYERSIENQQNALDKELESFQKEKEAESEALDKYLENTDAVVSDTLQLVSENSSVIYETLNAAAEEYSLNLSNAMTKPWKDGLFEMESYQEGFSSAVTSVVEQVALIEKAWQKVIDKMDEAAVAEIAKNDKEIDRYTEAEKSTSSTSSKSSSSSSSSSKSSSSSSKSSSSSSKSYPYGKASETSGNIGYGATGKKVKAIQWALKEMGYDIGKSGVDGSFGPATQKAVKKFQKAVGVSADGIVGNNTRKKFKTKGYALGTTGIKKDQWALIDELGEELVIGAQNGRLTYLTKGSGVVPADLTSNLMDWGELNPQDVLDRNRPSIGASPSVHATEVNLNIQYGDMLKIENFKGDNPDEIAKIVAKQFEKHTKDLNSALRKYVR